MANIINSLELNKIDYASKYFFDFDKATGIHYGKVKNKDLVVFLKNKDESKLKAELKKAVEMHCYMTTMEAITKSLNYVKKSSKSSSKPTCNILVPQVA